MNNQYTSAFAGSVAHKSQGTILKLQGLAKSLSATAPAATDTIKELAQDEERLKRRASLRAPDSERMFQGDLMWMAEKGAGEDLDLLYQTRKSPPYWSDYIAGLFDLAEQKILIRLHDSQQEMQTAFGLTEAEFARCLLGAGSAPVSQQAKQTAEMLRQIRQSWEDQFPPVALKDWFREPVPLFNGKTPLEAVKEGKAEEVWHVLIRLEEGVHY